MGLLRSGINEVIASTSFNSAPMGIHYREGKAAMVLFTGSHTAKNIERDGWVIANFIYDPVLYVRTAFEDLPREAYLEEVISGKKMHRLSGIDAWAAFTTTVERKTVDVMRVGLKPEVEIIEEVNIHPVNRGFNSIIDATVHATRFRENRNPDLRKLIDYHGGIVRKCGGKQELAALEMLMKYIEE